MAEWSKALDLGSSHFDGVGSNPTAATSYCFKFFYLQVLDSALHASFPLKFFF